jgi:hypothetical protein
MQNWSKGVELELHGVGSYRTVKSTEDAAQCLLAHWPIGKGKAYLEAQQACLDALEGSTSPEVAREAFIAAALAAKIHIRSTEDPRLAAVAAGKNRVPIGDSPAFRKANHDAMEAIKKTVAKIKAERAAEARSDNSGGKPTNHS